MTADGWTSCERGHRHWGMIGAAGLLAIHKSDDEVRFLLQHRAPKFITAQRGASREVRWITASHLSKEPCGRPEKNSAPSRTTLSMSGPSLTTTAVGHTRP